MEIVRGHLPRAEKRVNSRTLKAGLRRALLAAGFVAEGDLFVRQGTGVSTLVGLQKGFGKQWFLNVGFHLDALDGPRPERVELCHLYFRLERLFPQHLEMIRTAGALDEVSQPEAYQALLDAFPTTIDAELRTLGTDSGLRAALAEGRLGEGLVRKEVKELLSR